MGSESVEELPDDLEAWVAERAADGDTSRADVVRRLMAAHKLLDEHPDRLDDADASDRTDRVVTPADAAGSAVDDLDAAVDELAERVEELEGDLDEKIADVRQRVIQVKREADAKAPADHDHPSLERRVDEGFDNYEEVLEYLTERTETLEAEADDRSAKLRRVANAVVDLRRRVATLESGLEERDAVSDLREAANRRGISEAACGSCGESVQIGLLDRPACPHCESPFDGVEAGGWFRPNTLTVGNRPALESAPAASPSESQSERAGSAPSNSDGAEAPGSEQPADAPGGGPEGVNPGNRDGISERFDTDDATGEENEEPVFTPESGGLAGETTGDGGTDAGGDGEADDR
jgi:prefoldin subunit 5